MNEKELNATMSVIADPIKNVYKLEKRKKALYSSNPILKEIDDKLSEFSINSAKCILQNNSEKYLKDLKKLFNR